MKKLFSILMLLTLGIAGCNLLFDSGSNSSSGSGSESSPIVPSPANTTSPASPSPNAAFTVDEFSFDEISGRGCGMTLWHSDRTRRDRYIFFNELNEAMEMKINGEIVRFQRTEASGAEFYGQQTTQTFVSEDGSIQVTATVELGEPGEIESVAIQSGTLRVSREGEAIELAVMGDAGC